MFERIIHKASRRCTDQIWQSPFDYVFVSAEVVGAGVTRVSPISGQANDT